MSSFQKIDFYKNKKEKYKLLPFKFERMGEKDYVATNLVGEHIFISKDDLYKCVNHKLDSDSEIYKNLRSKHFLIDSKSQIALELLPIKLRTKYRLLSEFTGLHIFVVSLRCEHSCPYCQVSRQSDNKTKYDMTQEVADKALDLVMRSPSKDIKIEFQGGEPLLNFNLIKHIVAKANLLGEKHQKNISYVIATNLALIDKPTLEFCRLNNITISTSLDGPKEIHNKNRPRPGGNSYEKAIEGIKLARDFLGHDKVSALMTTTKNSLKNVKEIINEYVDRSFEGIFLRPLSPYGFALKTKTYSSYDLQEWLDFYKEGIDYIIELNKKGILFKEYYACTILTKIFTSQEPGYVDLMNPAGIGIGCVVYNYDGLIYASDESRMLAEMGDKTFEIGNVLTNSYDEIFLNQKLLDPVEESFTQSVPMCNDCAFENYCGADPVFHYAKYGDFVGIKPESEFCGRNTEIFKFLLLKMESDPYIKKLFMEWGQPNA